MLRFLLFNFLFFFIFSFNLSAVEFEKGDLSVQLYGELHFAGSYTHSDSTFINNPNKLDIARDVRDSLDLFFYNSSRVGAKLLFGNFSGRIELQAKFQGTTTNVPDSIFRLYYVTYHFEKAGEITIGKDWSSAGYFFDQYVNEYQALCGYGVLCQLRLPQVRYRVHGFEISLLYAGNDAFKNVNIDNSVNIKGTQMIPRFEVAYTIENKLLYLKLFASYGRHTADVSFEFENNSAMNSMRHLVADTFSIGVIPIFYIKDFTLSLSAFAGQNIYITGAMTNSTLLKPRYNYTLSKVDPIISLGTAVVAGYKFTEIISVAVGAGYTISSDNSFKGRNDDRLALYINMPIQAGKYIRIIPEIAYFDEMKDYNKRYEGNAMFYAVYFLFIF